MGDVTKIQWAHHTWNPWRGCQHALLPSGKENPACANCYAEAMSRRNPTLLGEWGPNGTRVVAAEQQWSLPKKWNAAAEKAGERRRVFVNSLSDFFEDWPGPMRHHGGQQLYHTGTCVPWTGAETSYYAPVTMFDVRKRAFAVFDECQWLDFLVLTKRPGNIGRMWTWPSFSNPVSRQRPNVWLGTSAGDQKSADELIPQLLWARDLSPVLFLSAEPLLGPIQCRVPVFHHHPSGLAEYDWTTFDYWIDGFSSHKQGGHTDRRKKIDWLIVGGESGPKARVCDVAWVRSIVKQCEKAGVPCFVKQMGQVAADNDPVGRCSWPGGTSFQQDSDTCRVLLNDPKGGNPDEWPEDLRVRQFPETW